MLPAGAAWPSRRPHGMLPAIRRNPDGRLHDAARRFGDVVYFKSGRVYNKLRTVLGNGLLTSEGGFWLRQRRIAQPAFHRQRITALAGVMTEAARDTAAERQTVASIEHPVDVAEEMMRLTRTIVLRALTSALRRHC